MNGSTQYFFRTKPSEKPRILFIASLINLTVTNFLFFTIFWEKSWLDKSTIWMIASSPKQLFSFLNTKFIQPALATFQQCRCIVPQNNRTLNVRHSIFDGQPPLITQRLEQPRRGFRPHSNQSFWIKHNLILKVFEKFRCHDESDQPIFQPSCQEPNYSNLIKQCLRSFFPGRTCSRSSQPIMNVVKEIIFRRDYFLFISTKHECCERIFTRYCLQNDKK